MPEDLSWKSWAVAVIAAIILATVIALWGFGLNAVLFPARLDVQRRAVQQSQGFNDSQLEQLLNLQREYTRLETEADTTAQRAVTLSQMCLIERRMARNAVPTEMRSWITSKGACL